VGNSIRFLTVDISTKQEADRTKADIYSRLAHALVTKTLGEFTEVAAQVPEAFLSCTECLREAIAYDEAQIKEMEAVEACMVVALSGGAGMHSGGLY
jgi:hypothetical protein